MSENIDLKEANQSLSENMTDTYEPIAESSQDPIVIPVKYNKQVFNLNLEKAQELAQKGMKFDVISKDYDALKSMARADGKSVGEFLEALKTEKRTTRESEILEKCGGDKEFAEQIMKLEQPLNEEVRGFKELTENFPKIESADALPASVLEAAKLKGTLLLDEYLRYLHKQEMAKIGTIKAQQKAEMSATGSLINKKGVQSPETAEFLRGLWQK